MKRYLLTTLIPLLTLAAFTPCESATVLTFTNADGNPLTNDAAVPDVYGDNVSASPENGFSYGLEGEPTPNVVVDYNPAAEIFTFGGEYGDLPAVIYSSLDYSIAFTADPGFLIRIDSFDVAAFTGNEGLTIGASVSNGTLPAYEQTEIAAPTSGHTTVDFAGGMASAFGQSVTLTFDIPNFNVGISNIRFEQVPVPEPTSAILLASGVVILGMVRRRRV